jgi:hypothetical protein
MVEVSDKYKNIFLKPVTPLAKVAVSGSAGSKTAHTFATVHKYAGCHSMTKWLSCIYIVFANPDYFGIKFRNSRFSSAVSSPIYRQSEGEKKTAVL